MKPINCKHFKKLAVDALYNYDQLTENDKRVFQGHLAACSSCALEYEETAALLGVMDQRQRPEMDEAFWDSYTMRLQDKIAKNKKEKSHNVIPLIKNFWESGPLGEGGRLSAAIKNLATRDQLRRWMLYPAAALVLVLVGIAIGRYIYLPPGTPPGEKKKVISRVLSPGRSISPAVAEHFDNLRPMLIDCANYPGQEESGSGDELILVDKKALKKLVLQNYLLKKIAARDNNTALKQLLEELELILLEISNAEPGETSTDNSGKESIRRVRDILTENDLLFKMKIYNQNKNKKKTPLKI